MDSQELLNQLADIRLPGEIGLWPPALGWWILLAILLVALYGVLTAYLKRRALQYSLNAALGELSSSFDNWRSAARESKTNATLEYVNTSNTILRRVALANATHKESIASLTGEAWIAFIRSEGDSRMLSEEIALALSQGRFQQSLNIDTEALHSFCASWITSMYITNKHNKNPLENSSIKNPRNQ